MVGDLINNVRACFLERICQKDYGHSHEQDHVMIGRAGVLEVTCCHPVDEPLVAPGGAACEDSARVPIGPPIIIRPGERFLVKAKIWHTVKVIELDPLTKLAKWDCDFSDGTLQSYSARETSPHYFRASGGESFNVVDGEIYGSVIDTDSLIADDRNS